MKKILFVCLGNICRSPMAEFILKDIVKKKKIENDFYIESAATSSEEIGNNIYYKAKKKLEENGITVTNRSARQIKKEDYNNFDFIIGMEEKNIRDIKRITEGDPNNKIYRLLDFSPNKTDISDPWYTNDFDKAYSDILNGIEYFLQSIGY